MRVLKSLTILVAAGLMIFSATAALADAKLDAEAKLKEAASAFKNVASKKGAGIPAGVLGAAKAVAVFPGLVKAGFVVGGFGGKGVLVQRLESGKWSAPAFFRMGGASLGLQIGAQSTDLVLCIMNDKGLRAFMDDSAKFGVDAGLAAGPTGEGYGTSFKADILSYAVSKGAFVGLNLEGAGAELDKDWVKALYGQPYTTAQILGGKAPQPADAQDLYKLLNDYSK